MLSGKRPSSVLLLVHSLPPHEFSGTPLVALGYARRLSATGIRTGVLYVSPRAKALSVRKDEAFGFERIEVPPTRFRGYYWSTYDSLGANPRRAQLLDTILDRFRPDLVHIIDIVNLPTEWPREIRRRGIPVLRQVCNMEDLCGMIDPISPPPPAAVCPAPVTPEQCAQCVARAMARRGKPHADVLEALLEKRRQVERAFREDYDRVLFPTPSFRAFWERTLPLAADRTGVMELGMEFPVARGASRLEKGGLVRLLFLGRLDALKGVKELTRVFSAPALLGRTDYELLIYGRRNTAISDGLQRINPRIRFVGGYQRGGDDHEHLWSALASCDAGLAPSRFETFHRVTREYLWAGLPVIGSRAFGIPEIIRDGENGLLFDVGDVRGFARAILRVLNDRELLAKLARGARATPIRSLENEVAELLLHYSALLAARRAPARSHIQ